MIFLGGLVRVSGNFKKVEASSANYSVLLGYAMCRTVRF